MARMRGPKFKQCRRLGLNVCGHPKAMKRHEKDPSKSRDAKRLSEYGVQLLEKQRLKAYYEILEKQFRRYVTKAMKSTDMQTGTALVQALETRLDNLVYRLGFASTIRQARQMVVHGHMLVNGKKVDIPSYPVKVGDVISLREKSRSNDRFKENFESNIAVAPYLTKEQGDFSGTLQRMPERDEVPIQIDDRYVVEFYSRLS